MQYLNVRRRKKFEKIELSKISRGNTKQRNGDLIVDRSETPAKSQTVGNMVLNSSFSMYHINAYKKKGLLSDLPIV